MFKGQKLAGGTLYWRGPLRPKAKIYEVSIFWKAGDMPLPYVVVSEPRLSPRPQGRFEEIPHLLFNEANPELSGLCLFDPDGREWSEADLIADTTVFWAAEWLVYYELWHLTGEWMAPSIGYESVASMRDEEADIIKGILADVY